MSKKFSMNDGRCIVPSGSGQLPDRGTTWFKGDKYGAEISPTDTNSKGGIHKDTQSHVPEARPGVHNQRAGH